jgi:hypothetical protein
MVLYYGLSAHAYWRNIMKAGLVLVVLGLKEEELRRPPAKGWSEKIRKVCEVDPFACPECGGLLFVELKGVFSSYNFHILRKPVDPMTTQHSLDAS